MQQQSQLVQQFRYHSVTDGRANRQKQSHGVYRASGEAETELQIRTLQLSPIYNRQIKFDCYRKAEFSTQFQANVPD